MQLRLPGAGGMKTARLAEPRGDPNAQDLTSNARGSVDSGADAMTDAVKETLNNATIGNGKPGPGRPKGSKNKISSSAKAALMEVFNELGGVDEMVRWATQSKNRSAFYALWARLIPHDVKASEGPVEVRVVFRHEGRRIAASSESTDRPTTDWQ